MAKHRFRKSKPDGLWVPSGGTPIDRREFVETVGGIVLGTSLGGCSTTRDGPTPLPPTDKGFLHGIITGLDASATSGGSVTGNRTDISGTTPVTIPNLPANGDLTVEVDVGTYTLDYTPPDNHALAPGEINPKTDVVVTKGNTTDVTWTVVVAQATVRVVVTGLEVGASGGGSASILRTDIAGQSPVTANVPATGQVDTGVLAGTYQVTYTAPAGYSIVGGVTNPVSLSVTAGVTSTATFGVTKNGGTSDIYESGFEDGTAGSFINSAIQQLPLTGPWLLDITTAARGAKSIKQVYNQNAGNTGAPFFFTFPTPVQKVYVRLGYKQSSPFNSVGGVSNNDVVKMIRFKRTPFGNMIGSFLIAGATSGPGKAGAMFWSLDDLDTSPFLGSQFNNVGTFPGFNTMLDSWHWIEIMYDISTTNALQAQVWVDDVLYLDRTMVKSNGGFSMAQIQFDGTINSMSEISTAWFDEIGISTQKMGIPA